MRYKDRDLNALAKLYAEHVEAMTEEHLRDKADIAAELAFRDALIQRLLSSMRLVLTARSRGFDIHYTEGVAESAVSFAEEALK